MSRSWKLHPVTQLTLVRVLEFVREPEAIFWSYVFPLVMILALGMAFRSEPVEAVAVVIQDGEGAADILETLKDNPNLIATIKPAGECRRLLRSGASELIVMIEAPTSAAKPATPGSGTSTLRYVFDPTRPGSVRARDVVNNAVQQSAGRTDVLKSQDETFTEPGGRYIDFLVPGLIGMGLMGNGIWGVGFGIVDMRIRQLLKRFVGTPMRRHHFILAMLISRVIFMIPEILIVLVASRLIFGVTNHGNWLTVLLIVSLGAFEFAGIGLLIASRAKTLEAVSGLMNLSMVPMWIGSGIFFSPERFPVFLQPLISIIPLTPLISSLRRVMQEGAGLADVWLQILIIAVWGLATFFIALRRFRWE